MTAFDKAGYLMQEFELDSSQMGVPQKRERVFFLAIRKDLVEILPRPQGLLFSEFPYLNMKFGRSPIPFEEIRTECLRNNSWTDHDQYIWDRRVIGDRKFSDVLIRTQGRNSNFNSSFIYPHKPVPTIASSEGSKYVLFDEPRKMNSKEMILAQSFPLDYDFGSDKCGKVQYVVGMSVPPIMVATLVTRIYNEWKVLFK
jgi:DNA (cytosine-5)-methyltransferase 1